MLAMPSVSLPGGIMAKRPRRLFAKLSLFITLAVGVFFAFWFGLVPNWMLPFPTLSLEHRPSLFVDARLSALRFDRALCRQVLRSPGIQAQPISDRPLKDGCGWENAVRISQVGGASMSVGQLSCETAAALAFWVQHEVQPLARDMYGQEVVRISGMGTYSCRNIVGNPLWKNMRSQHATANAIDISGFTFADGRSISLIKDWRGKGKDSAFLREIQARSCRYFRVSLGPNANPAHRDHFHFDRGLMWACR